GRTLGQAAIQFALAQPSVVTVLPNFTSEANVAEFTAAPDVPPLTEEEQVRIRTLWDQELRELLDQPYADSEKKPIPVAR
ncbi:MAG TPA: aldo/keto reductase, partial [Alicyclobacillus sp.]|nr:aldo/keto reductase [Alicyclobacillus sp.]